MLQPLTDPSDPSGLAGRVADAALLGAAPDALPPDVPPPPPAPPERGGRALVVLGAGLTGLSLLAGLALLGLAVAHVLGHGPVLWPAVAGAFLVATHWGWVHVAEAVRQARERPARRAHAERQAAWLAALAPYTRHIVTTRALEDGAIRLERTALRPVPTSRGTFAFAAEPEASETLPAETPAAQLAARAEELRQAAARATAQERERWARHATAMTLSDAINADLRDAPPEE